MTVQIRNAQMVELLKADFQGRWEPNFAWGNALSAFSLLPGLRGFWPMSANNESGFAIDQSGAGRYLTYNGNPVYSWQGLAPNIQFDGAGDYLSRGDEAGLDITGAETFFPAALNGLTLGGWFYFFNLATGANQGMIGKYNDNGVGERSYMIYLEDASNTLRFIVSADGGAVVQVSSAAVSAGNWYFVAGRFDPSTELAIFLNGVKVVNGVGVPASLYSGAADFNIGAYSNGASGLMAGAASLCFLCAAALPDVIINSLFYQTCSLFGVTP